MKKQAAILGAGGHSRVISSILKANNINIFGIFDDSYSGLAETIKGSPLLGQFDDIMRFREDIDSVYLALGDNLLRRKHFNYMIKKGFLMPQLIHPTAIIESDAVISKATTVCLGAIIGTEATIGKGCIINSGCSVDHESSIGDYVHLAPHVSIAGRTSIGDNTFVGINATIADKITIGKNVLIGAGSVILSDVRDGEKIIGIYR